MRKDRSSSTPLLIDADTGRTSEIGAWNETTDEPQGWRRYLSGEYAKLTLALVVLVLARTCDQTLYYRLSEEYRYFVWYFSSVILAVPISFVVVWYKMLCTKDITPEMRRFPQYKFAIMGLFDTSFNVFSTFPIQHLGGDLANVLSQTILPINMIGSYIFLKTRFKKVHYWGALLVIYGIMVKLSDSIGTPAFSGAFGWIVLAVLSNIPSAASNVYKETGLKADDLDIWYANAWIGVWQLLWGLLTVWTIFIPAFVAPHPRISVSELPKFVSDANKCFFGSSVDLTDNSTAFEIDCVDNGNEWIADTATCRVDCDVNGTPISVFCIYIIFNLTYNVLALYVFKKGSSVLFVVANAVRLPLVDALNSVKFVSGVARETIGKYDYFALFALVMAIFVYYSEPDNEKEGQEKAPKGRAAKAGGRRRRRTTSRSGLEQEYNIVVVSPRVAGAFRNRYASQDGRAQPWLQSVLARFSPARPRPGSRPSEPRDTGAGTGAGYGSGTRSGRPGRVTSSGSG